VSAECVNVKLKPKYEKKVIPKTEEQLKRIHDAVAHSFLFDNLNQDQKKEIFDAMFEKKIGPGEVVITQGDLNADNFYVVDDGELDCIVKGVNDGNPVVHYKQGGSFGELALMYNAPRAATIKCCAGGGATLWAVDRETFRHVVVLSRSTQRTNYEGWLKGIGMLSNLADAEKSKLADALVEKDFEDGQVVIKEGDDDFEDMHFYLIENGVAVATQGDVEVGVMTEGGYFGEKALIEHKPRAATVTAKGPLKVACLDCAAFERVMGPCKEIMARAMADYKSAEDVLKDGAAATDSEAATEPAAEDTPRPESEAAETPRPDSETEEKTIEEKNAEEEKKAEEAKSECDTPRTDA
jgi:cAMP-dependent protein kinase regulator